MLKRIWTWIRTEPVMAWQVTAAVLALAGSFGLQLTAEQTAAVFGLFQLLAGLAGRQLVRPESQDRQLQPPRRIRRG